MKLAYKFLLSAVLVVVLLVVILRTDRERTGTLDPKLAEFITTKQLQAQELADLEGVRFPPTADKIFTAVLADDWRAATNLFNRLEVFHSAPANPSILSQANDWARARLESVGILNPSAPGPQAAWEPFREAYWIYVLSKNWQQPRLEKIVHEIMATIGTNSIYLGGTDVGRFAITAAMASHKEGRPCFVLTQNQLAQGNYLAYAGSMFSNHIYVPTLDDAQQTFQNYLADAKRRQQAGKLRKDETVVVDTNGMVSVSGPGAFWEMSGQMAKVVFDQNTTRDIYIEQSTPLSWTYPHLVPSGPIFKLNREPLDRLSETMVQRDRAYWSNQCAALIGDWITAKTSFSNVCDFVERVYLRRELTTFKGDPHYLQETVAQEYISKLRLSTADLYLWRCVEAKDTEEKERMWSECLLALRQALALGPGNFETATYFKNVLVDVKNYDDAIAIMRVAFALNPAEQHFRNEIERIQKLKAEP